MLKALNRKAIALAATLQSMYLKAASEERGDTNFISILIILGIVILVAGVFIGFKDQIVGQVQAIVGEFTIR